MPKDTRGSGSKSFTAGSHRWIAGMVIGQLLGFALALAAGASVPVMLIVLLTGGAIGGIGTMEWKLKKAAAPLRDKNIRAYVFQALAETSKKLDEIIIEEEFNTVSGSGESDRRAMKQEAKPKLAIPMPAPPKMGGM